MLRQASRPPSAGFPAALYLLLVAGVPSACAEGSRTAPELELLPAPDPALSWIGDWVGSGSGEAVGMPWEQTGLVLEVRLDAPPVTLPECPYCLTVTLDDTLFAGMNLPAPSPVELHLTSEKDGVVRTLDGFRYSGGGGTANVLEATLLAVDATGDTLLSAQLLLTVR